MSPDLIVAALIEQRYGRRWPEIRQSIDAIALPATRAAALRAQPDSPALQIVRHDLDEAGTIVEMSSTVHPAGRLTVSRRLRRMTENGPS